MVLYAKLWFYILGTQLSNDTDTALQASAAQGAAPKKVKLMGENVATAANKWQQNFMIMINYQMTFV